MNTSLEIIEKEQIAMQVDFTDDMICILLEDGRAIQTPLEFYPRLARATMNQLTNFRLMGGGSGIHWPEIEEDLSVESIVMGRRAKK